MLEDNERRISADSEQYRQRFAELAQSGRLVAPRFGNDSEVADAPQSVHTYTEGGNSGAGSSADTVGNIIQITVATFIELAVQPHQVRISSGGGGGSDRGGWNDKDREKNEYKPRRRR